MGKDNLDIQHEAIITKYVDHVLRQEEGKTTKGKFIGLSLSLCVADIVNGRMAKGDVLKIISGTCFSNEEIFKQMLIDYKDSHWNPKWFGKDNSEAAAKLALDFYNEGKIYQPRLDKLEAPFIGYGTWISIDKRKFFDPREKKYFRDLLPSKEQPFRFIDRYDWEHGILPSFKPIVRGMGGKPRRRAIRRMLIKHPIM